LIQWTTNLGLSNPFLPGITWLSILNPLSLSWATWLELGLALFSTRKLPKDYSFFSFIHLVHGKGLKLWTLGLKGEIVSIASLFFFFENIMQEKYFKW
jgi:hypothetical protein